MPCCDGDARRVLVTASIWLGPSTCPLAPGQLADGAWRALLVVAVRRSLGAASGCGALAGRRRARWRVVWMFVLEPFCWVSSACSTSMAVAEYLPAAASAARSDRRTGAPVLGGRGLVALRMGRAPSAVALFRTARRTSPRRTPGWPRWPRPSTRERSSSSTSTRSHMAATASLGTTASSSSSAVECPATRTRAGHEGASAASPRASSPRRRRAPSRVEAPCRHFGVCGGCRFQDLAYDVQVAEKERQVRDALVRIGRFDEPPLEPIVPAESQFRLSQQARVLVHDRARTASTSASIAPAAGTR